MALVTAQTIMGDYYVDVGNLITNLALLVESSSSIDWDHKVRVLSMLALQEQQSVVIQDSQQSLYFLIAQLHKEFHS